MKKITLLTAFLLTAMSYGQIIADGDLELSSTGVLPKTATSPAWFSSTNRTTTPMCVGGTYTIPAREDNKIEDESGNNVAVFYDNNENCKGGGADTVVSFAALLNQTLDGLEASTSYIVQFDIKYFEEAPAKDFEVQIRTNAGGFATRQMWFETALDGTANEDFGQVYLDFAGIGTTFATKKVRFTTGASFDGATTYYLCLTKPTDVFSSPTAKLIVDNISVVEDPTASVQDLEKLGFSFYPNPSKDRLNLSAAKNIQQIELYNTLGQSVLSKDLNARKASLDISSLTKGIYIMKLAIEGFEGSYKIIKE